MSFVFVLFSIVCTSERISKLSHSFLFMCFHSVSTHLARKLYYNLFEVILDLKVLQQCQYTRHALIGNDSHIKNHICCCTVMLDYVHSTDVISINCVFVFGFYLIKIEQD